MAAVSAGRKRVWPPSWMQPRSANGPAGVRRPSTTAGACGAGCGRWLSLRARPACGLAAADLAAWPACRASGAHRRAHHVWGGPRSRAWVLPARSAMICANGMPPGSARNGYVCPRARPASNSQRPAPADPASRSPPGGPRATPCPAKRSRPPLPALACPSPTRRRTRQCPKGHRPADREPKRPSEAASSGAQARAVPS